MRLRTRRPSSSSPVRAFRRRADCRRFAVSAAFGGRIASRSSPRAEGFARDPLLVWTWYNERKAAHARADPMRDTCARTPRAGAPRFTLATQNVDSLQLRAGSRNVVELHGSLREARCTVARNADRSRRRACRWMNRARMRRPDGGPISSGSASRSTSAWIARTKRRIARRRHPRRRHERRSLPGGRAGDAL